MDKQNSLVSIIIPTYNRATYLREAIESVIAQTYKDWEMIIIDDGSTDKTKELVTEYSHHFNNIKYIYQDHKRLPEARNNGILNSHGEYIAFIDDDDLWLPEKLKKQVEILDKCNDIGLVYSQVYIVDEQNNRHEIADSSIGNDTFQDIFERCYIQISSVLLRRECFEKVGPFDKSLILAEDYDMWLRILKIYKHMGLKEPLVKYRKHSTNMTLVNNERNLHTIKVIRKSFKSGNNISLNCYRMRIAKLHYHFAMSLLNTKKYIRSMFEFCNAVINHPFVGIATRREKEKSKIYHLFKPYFAIFLCLFKNFQNVIFEKK